jgi:hypothetical protein
MHRLGLSIAITVVAVILAGLHLAFPHIEVDALTSVLALIAFSPWLAWILKSIELPGGVKLEYRDLERIGREAATAGLDAAPKEERRPPKYGYTAQEDPNLALAGLRIEIERRLRAIADAKGWEAQRVPVRQVMRQLASEGVISKHEESVLDELMGLLNSAVHGAQVAPESARWAAETGPRLLAALEETLSGLPEVDW